MDKRTIIAIALSIGILVIWSIYQAKTNPPESSVASMQSTQNSTQIQGSISNNGGIIPAPLEEDTINEEQLIALSTNIYDIVYSSKNGTIHSLHLVQNNSADNGENAMDLENLNLIPQGELGQAFRILWGDNKQLQDSPDVFYNVRRNGKTIEFYRDFLSISGTPFTVRKIYTIKNDEYVIELNISITNSKNEIITLGEDYAYSLFYGPQLGPYAEIVESQKSKQLSRRRLAGRDSKKVRFINLKNNRTRERNQYYQWVGITGRYISLLILTGSTSYITEFSTMDSKGLNSGAQILLRRPEIKSAAVEDRYRIYIGPNTRKTLKRYEKADNNAFGLQGTNFSDITPTRLLGFLQGPLHAALLLIHKAVPNYGFAIIILTLLVRLCTLPIIKKSKEAGKKMKNLGPKMKIIRERYADDPTKMNQEMMALYKKEKVSPFSSMVPMLIQLPIFLSMYRVFYESIELWQAPFIGWIHDLSIPDQLISFSSFAVPFLGWKSLNILPIIMISTQFISSFIMMKQQDMSAAGSKKMIFIMSYVFPFMIFFALYNSPSGLILYWICSNIFTVFSMTDWKKKDEPTEPIINKKKKKLKV